MCFKSFLHACDKACHHQHYLPILVWPTARTFRPSHVNGLTLDPNWPLLQRGCLVSQTGVFKFWLWNLSSPTGSFLHGWGIRNWQTQTTRVPVWAQRRTHQTGFPDCLAPVGPDSIPDRSREKLNALHPTHPHSSLSTNRVTGDGFCSHVNAHIHRAKLCKH